MEPHTILVTGASGYLGRRVVRMGGRVGEVVGTRHTPNPSSGDQTLDVIDVGDANEVYNLVAEITPTVILHLAAVNPGQGDAEAMWRANVDGSANIAEAAQRVGARLVAVSSDVVHDGTAAPYADDAVPHPLNDYARSKAAGEDAVLAACPDALVVRPSLIYGTDEMDRGTEGFVQRVHRGEHVSLFTDVIRNPVWVETLADALLRFAVRRDRGTMNVAGREPLTREAFGRMMLAYWGVEDHGLVVPGLASEVSDTIPTDLRLRIDRAESLLGVRFPGVSDVLAAARGRVS
ncbi:MAG: SDR family oxidoreductase [Acidimicrobiia bacterium]